MNAVRLIDTAVADIDTTIREMVGDVVSWASLSADREADLRHTAHRIFLDLIHASDALVAAAVELEALDTKLDEHVRGCLRRCRWWSRRHCSIYQSLQRRRDRQQSRYDALYRAFVARGGRR